MIGCAAHFTSTAPSGAGKGREPQQGTDGKHEQSQPWAESQNREWKAGAGTAMGREPTQGTEGRSRDSHGQRANAGNGRQAGIGQ